MKAVSNDVLDSNFVNDNCGEPEILLDNRYDCPELFVLIFEEMNHIGIGTCRNSRIYFPGNDELSTFLKVA